jgi:hypothetical protein
MRWVGDHQDHSQPSFETHGSPAASSPKMTPAQVKARPRAALSERRYRKAPSKIPQFRLKSPLRLMISTTSE